MRKTIAQKKKEEMTAKGYTYVGMTTGQLSYRKGSNLSSFLSYHGLEKSDVVVAVGAKLQYASQGTQLLVFKKK